jgi:uncharacterized membrane protein YhiD involved in acid resistance
VPEYLSHFNIDEQTIGLVVISMILTFLLGCLLIFTYEKSSQMVMSNTIFIQAMLLMPIVTCMVMQSIGDSVARGFGIFGALAILRFRVDITGPRNIAFIFAAMAIGISSGVYSFVIAIVGTFAFCLVAFILRFTPYSKRQNLLGELVFQIDATKTLTPEVDKTLKKHCYAVSLKRYRFTGNEKKGKTIEYTYLLQMKKEMNGAVLLLELEPLDLQKISLTFNDITEQLND